MNFNYSFQSQSPLINGFVVSVVGRDWPSRYALSLRSSKPTIGTLVRKLFTNAFSTPSLLLVNEFDRRFITVARECSPAITATHHSNGRFCDFLLFFCQDPWGSDPSTDRHAKWLKRRGFGQGCAFWSKNWKFLYHLTPAPKTTKIWPLLVWTQKIFARFRFTIRGLTSKHP